VAADVRPGLRYHPQHQWAQRNGDQVTVGITDFAQEQLGEVVWAGLPKVGDRVEVGSYLTEVESVKTSAEVTAPVTGRVVAVNSEIEENPGLLNGDAYGAWIAVIELTDVDTWDALLDAGAYRDLIDGGGA